ncbi:MAG: NAD(P)/FAD-dependent oxidoreductase [Candidatus Velthaea sp.]
MPVPQILILGGGFAGIATAQRLERKLRAGEADITLVSRENFTLFTPMLPEVSSGGIETRHVVTPVRAQLKRTTYVLGEVVAIDLDARRVEVTHALTGASVALTYDHVVLALGSVTSTFNIPGVAEQAIPLKTIEDADVLRNRIIASLELADIAVDPIKRKRLLTYTIVGGGYTGCEAAGELVDFLRSISRFYATIDAQEIQLVLVEASKKLLVDLPEGMGRYTARNLAQRGVQLEIGDGVACVDAEGITLQSGRRIETATVVWSAGVRPAPILKDLPLEHARNGGIYTGRDMRTKGSYPGVWAIGDSAWIPMAQDGKWYPSTAQHAIREGPVLGDNIVATLRGEATKPFDFTALGTMASLGARRGVVGFPNGFILTGFFAWVLWRSYYLMRLPGLDRRLRVAFDWLLGLFFSRDIAELRVYTDRAQRNAARDAGLDR